jgi:hypothetical protein
MYQEYPTSSLWSESSAATEAISSVMAAALMFLFCAAAAAKKLHSDRHTHGPDMRESRTILLTQPLV